MSTAPTDPDVDDANAEYEALLEFVYLCPLAIAQLDQEGQVEMMNPMGAQLFLQLSEGPSIENLFDVLQPFVPELRDMVRGLSADQGSICEALRVDAGLRQKRAALPLVLSLTALKIGAGRIMVIAADISKSVAQERSAREAESRFRAVLDGVRDYAIFSVGLDGTIESWNKSAERTFGFSPDEVLGQRYDILFHGDRVSARARADELASQARAGGFAEDEGYWARKTSTRFWGSSVLSVVEDELGAPTGFTCVTRDLTKKKRAEDELVEAATTDFLTGVYNRRHFLEVGRKELSRARRHADPLSLVMLDADHFKKVNDTYGHATGDEVLRAFARTCLDQVRDVDVVCRLGGEEFAVLLPSTDLSGARAAAERIRIAVEGLRLGGAGLTVRFTVSAGVVELGPEARDVEGLLDAADKALYEAKRRGRNQTVVVARSGPAPSAAQIEGAPGYFEVNA